MDPLASTANHAVHLLDYNKQEIKQLGSCYVSVRFTSTVKRMHFYVIPDRLKPIIGMSDALALGLISFHCPIFNNWHSTHDLTDSIDSIQKDTKPTVPPVPEPLTKDYIINHPKYSKLFSGIGHFRCNPVHITMKQNDTSIQKPPCHVPIAMKDKFKAELDSMETQGIISKFDGRDVSPQWLNSFVIVKKPSGALRICLDPTDLNKEIIRPVCNVQTIDYVIDKLKQAK